MGVPTVQQISAKINTPKVEVVNTDTEAQVQQPTWNLCTSGMGVAFLSCLVFPIFGLPALLVGVCGYVDYKFKDYDGFNSKREKTRRLSFWGLVAGAIVITLILTNTVYKSKDKDSRSTNECNVRSSLPWNKMTKSPHTSCDKLTAYQSSTGTWGGIVASARLAIDRDANDRWFDGSCTHTAPGDPDPSLTIDLGCPKEVHSIAITNRRDCCAQRLNDFEVVLTNNPYGATCRNNGTTCAYHEGTFVGSKTIQCQGNGRYVTVRYKDPSAQPPQERFLHICEIKIDAE